MKRRDFLVHLSAALLAAAVVAMAGRPRTREITARMAEDSRSRTYQEALDAPSWV
jgi:hypothetical protein